MRERDLCGFCGKEILLTREDRDGSVAAYRRLHRNAKAYRCPVGDWWHISKGGRRDGHQRGKGR